MPVKNSPKIMAIKANVPAALRALGFLKNGTAFEIASTPVKLAEPLEKALSKRMIEIPGTVDPI